MWRRWTRDWRGARRRARAAVAALALLPLVAGRGEARPALRFDSPFAPALCDRAIAEGRRQMAAAPSAAARQLLAEGYLCRGVQGDAWALGDATRLLRAVLVAQPGNFFAQLERADAVRLRFPLAPAAARYLRRARVLLARSDVGAARLRLAAYIDENLAALGALRGPGDAAAALAGGADAPPPAAIIAAAGWLVPRGRRESRGVAAALAAYLDAHPADVTARLQQADALRGVAPLAVVRALYEAITSACPVQGATRGRGSDPHVQRPASAPPRCGAGASRRTNSRQGGSHDRSASSLKTESCGARRCSRCSPR